MEKKKMLTEFNGLPTALSVKENLKLFEAKQNGDKNAREKLITGNLKLVMFRINKRFLNVIGDDMDLISIGIIGLIKAVDTYDLAKGYQFDTYAIRCIDNEILMHLRKISNALVASSIDEVLFSNESGETLLKDTLKNDYDDTKNIERFEINKRIKDIINTFDDKDQFLIKSYFGFYETPRIKQAELSKKLGLSQPQISRKISKLINCIKKILNSEGYIELNSKNKIKMR